MPDDLSLLDLLHQLLLLLLVRKQVSVNEHLLVQVLLLLDSGQLHAVIPETILPPGLDVCDFLHGLDGLDVEVSIVLYWLMSLLLELED